MSGQIDMFVSWRHFLYRTSNGPIIEMRFPDRERNASVLPKGERQKLQNWERNVIRQKAPDMTCIDVRGIPLQWLKGSN